jgi:hypothetical protein
MKTMVLGIVAGLALAGSALAAEHPEHPKGKAKESAEGVGKLDGKMFVGEIGKKGEAKGDKDHFVFKKGQFLSTACEGHGFKHAPYTCAGEGDALAFTAEPKNEKGETMSWKGTVKGDTIEGVAINRSAGDKPETVEYWFKGSLKAEGGEAEHPKKEGEHPKKEHPEHPPK